MQWPTRWARSDHIHHSAHRHRDLTDSTVTQIAWRPHAFGPGNAVSSRSGGRVRHRRERRCRLFLPSTRTSIGALVDPPIP